MSTPSTPNEAFDFSMPLENETELLARLLDAIAKGQLAPEVWEQLDAAIERDDKTAEFAMAFEGLAQDRRKLAQAGKPAAAELLYRAAEFVRGPLGDDDGAQTYYERALREDPLHELTRQRILHQIETRDEPPKRLTDVLLDAARKDSPEGFAPIYRRVARVLVRNEAGQKQAINLLEEAQRRLPNEETMAELAEVYRHVGKWPELARVLEQLLGSLEGDREAERMALRQELLDLFVNKLSSPERALPFAEALLEAGAHHEEARALCLALLGNKGTQARAALALAKAASGFSFEEVRYLELALEATRGPQRKDILKRLGTLKEDPIGDLRGALEAFEGALLLDATDDDVRAHYKELALRLDVPADAAKTLMRIAPSAKDAALKARIAVDTGILLARGGDPKRAKSTLSGVLSAAGAEPEAQLRAAQNLATLHELDNDVRGLTGMLERIAALETDDTRRDAALARLAELAELASDADKAIGAYVQLAERPAYRSRALERLEELYERTERWSELAEVLTARSEANEDPEQARRLAFRSAELLGGRAKNLRGAEQAWASLAERYGTTRELLAEYIPVLEQLRSFDRLDQALVDDLQLAGEGEKATLHGRLAVFRVRKRSDFEGGKRALIDALRLDAEEPQARQLAESLLADKTHRGFAAQLLAPLYRAETDSGAALLKVLEISGQEAEQHAQRLDAWSEAATLAHAAASAKAIDFATRALQEAKADELEAHVEPLQRILTEQNAGAARRAEAWSQALGEREVDDPATFALAVRAGEALESAGNHERAAAVYRQAARFAPDDQALLQRIDGLLSSLGRPEERLVVFDESLANTQDPAARHALYVQIAQIHANDLHAPLDAIQAYEQALSLVPGDEDAQFASIGLRRALGQTGELVDSIDRFLPHARAELLPGLQLEAARALGAQDRLDEAVQRASSLLDHAHTSEAELEAIEQLAETWGNTAFLVRTLWKKVERTELEAERAMVCLRLAGLVATEQERQRALHRAVVAATNAQDDALILRALGEYAQSLKNEPPTEPGEGDDFVLALVAQHERAGHHAAAAVELDALVARSPRGEVRRQWALRLAELHESSLQDTDSAYAVLAREVEQGDHEREVLDAARRLAIATGNELTFAALLDAALAPLSHETWSGMAGDEAVAIGITKARTFSADDRYFARAAEAYEALLELAAVFAEASVSTILDEYYGFTEQALERGVEARAQRRKTQRLRVDRAPAHERAALLGAWAKEESTLDTVLALALYEELLGYDAEDLDAHVALAKLAIENGDLDKAEKAIEEQRRRAEGDQRVRLELELAELHLDHGRDPRRALDALRNVLGVVPSDRQAFVLLERIAEDDAHRPEVLATLREGIDRALELGDLDSAVVLLQRTLELSSELSGKLAALRELAAVLQRSGRDAEELDALVQSAALDPASDDWDRAEDLARSLVSPEPLAAAYAGLDYAAMEAGDADRIGERAIAFFSEWYEDAAKLQPLLERLFEVPATSQLAFDRLRLLYDTNERWDDLFALYDRAIARAERHDRESLLEEIAHVAKDFAKNEARAAGYYEALLDLRPKSASTESALERLYERLGEHEKLVALLAGRRGVLPDTERAENDRRVARLQVETLGDASSALAVLQTTAGDAPLDAELVELYELVLQVADDADTQRRAAARLAEHYEGESLEDLARVLRSELDATDDPARQRDLLERLSSTELGRARGLAAVEALAEIVRRFPDDTDAQRTFTSLARAQGEVPHAVQVLATLADERPEGAQNPLRLLAAREAHQEAGLLEQAARLFRLVLDDVGMPHEQRVESAIALEALYETLGATEERLTVFERHANLLGDGGESEQGPSRASVLHETGMLARATGERERAVHAFEERLALEPGDRNTLDHLVALYDELGQRADHARVLERRAGAPGADAASRTRDRHAAARIHDQELGNHEHAITLLGMVLTSDGETAEVLSDIAKLHAKLEQWPQQRQALERAVQAATAGHERAVLLAELGALHAEHLESLPAAIEAFERALGDDAGNTLALLGLASLLENTEHRARAAELLLAAYRSRDDFDGILSLVEVRVATAGSAKLEVAVLTEAAELEEQRRGDSAAAYKYAERAFLLAPARESLRREATRLAVAADELGALRESYELVLGSDESLGLEVHLELARLLETPLADHAAALARFKLVLETDETVREAALALLRLGVLLEQYKLVAKVLGLFVDREETLADDVLAATRTYLEVPERALGLAAALERLSARRKSNQTPLLWAAARWTLSLGHDQAGAARLLRGALQHDAENVELLGELVAVERTLGGVDLVDSLTNLSRVSGGDLELLTEASEIALGLADESKLARSTLGLLRSLAIGFWTSQHGDPRAQAVARWARGKLEELYEREQRTEARVNLLVQDAEQPWDDAEKRELLMRAARLADRELAEPARAVSLYERLFEHDRLDLEVRELLRELLARQGDTSALLHMLERELEVTTDPQERAALRVRIAELDADAERAEAVLREALQERPRDRGVVEALATRLELAERHEDLLALYTDQGERALAGEVLDTPDIETTIIERRSRDGLGANRFFSLASLVAEHRLQDPRRALALAEAAVRAAVEPTALETAARLATSLERHAVAAHYLEKQLQLAPTEATALRLATALERNKEPVQAVLVLEAALLRDETSGEVRSRLAGHYRQSASHDKLAPLLDRGELLSSDPDEKLALLLEASALYTEKLGRAPLAIELLRRAEAIAPDNRVVQLALADALGLAGELQPARDLLGRLLESYGTRRPKDRAPLHVHLAKLDQIQGDDAQALVELDLATKIDPTYQPALRALGELAERRNEWDKAERAYRALLSVSRRSEPKDQGEDLVSAEVLLLLSRVATAKGEPVRGSEILETAFEAAADSPVEARRLEARLRGGGDLPSLARILRLRAERHDAGADTLAELARMELRDLGEPERAYSSALTAFQREPGRRIGDLVLEIASALGKQSELRDELARAVDTLERQGELGRAARHASLLAWLARRNDELDESVRWLEWIKKASELSEDDAELYAEVLAGRGDHQGQIEALELLLAHTTTPEKARRAKRELARILMQSEAGLERGTRHLLEARQQGESLETLLDTVVEASQRFPKDETLSTIYLQFARELDRPEPLTHALLHAWTLRRSELSYLEEALQRARGEDDIALQTQLLDAVVNEASGEDDRQAAHWARLELASLREQQGDVDATVEHLRRASQDAEEHERDGLLTRLALYAREHERPGVAAQAYAQLFAAHPEDAGIQQALFDLYRQTGQYDTLAELLADLASHTTDPSERVRLQFERLAVLEESGVDDAELIGPLRDLVLEAPEEAAAAERLLILLERGGQQRELLAVLDHLFESALDRGAHEATVAYALRLAAHYEQSHDAQSAERTLGRALEVLPQQVALLGGLADLLRRTGDSEKLEGVLELLIEHSEPHAAALLSLELAAASLARGDQSAARAALERAHSLDPGNEQVSTELEARYRADEEPGKLAELLASSATTHTDVAQRIVKRVEAARLYRDVILDASRAAELLVEAEAESPHDFTLTAETGAALALAGEANRGAELLVARARPNEGAVRARYLGEAAKLLVEVDPLRAAATMEEAVQLEGRGALAEAWLDFLEGLLDAIPSGTQPARRSVSLRLARTLADRGDAERAKEIVDAVLVDDPEDAEALLYYAELEERDGRLDDALGSYMRAFAVEHSGGATELALRIAHLAEQLERPEEARLALERVRLLDPEHREIRERLEQLYEMGGHYRSLAEVCLELAALSDDADVRFGYLLKGGSAYLESGEDFELALEPLGEALQLRPGDLDAVALLSDAYTAVGRVDEASALLDDTLQSLRGRRSREIGTLHHRVARVAQARGDRQAELAALTTALEMDPQNGFAAYELSQVAVELGDLELAARALRALTMLRGEGPIPRALAYKQLGEIAWAQGDSKRAVLMLKRALDDDPQLEEARELLAQFDRR